MRAIILVDIQNDFLPDGALAVNDGDKIIPIVNKLTPTFDLVVMTQDFTPPITAASQRTIPACGLTMW